MSYGIKFLSRAQLKEIITDLEVSAEVSRTAEVTLQAYELHLSLQELLISQLPDKEQN
jgi:flavoprotein